MSIYEFNEEEVYAMWAEEYYEDTMNAGRVEGQLQLLESLIHDGVLTEEDAASRLGTTVEAFREMLQKQPAAAL